MPNVVGLVHVDREYSAAGRDAWRRRVVTTDSGIMRLGFAVRVPALARPRPHNAHRVGSHGCGRLQRAALLDRTRCCGEELSRVEVDRSTADEIFPILREFGRAAA